MDAPAEFFSLTSGEKTMAIIVGVAACISVSSIFALSMRVAVAAIRPVLQGLKGRNDSREALFIRTQLGAYITSLLTANLLSGVAGLFEFSWASKGAITTGLECTAQGSLIQIGDFAGAYFTAIIAIHTFLTLVLHRRSSPWAVVLTIGVGWGTAIALGTAVAAASTSKHGPFFSSVGLWCAISSGYTVEQFVVYYLPIILSAFVTASLYAIIYLCLRGTLLIGGGIKLNLSADNVHSWAGRLNGHEEYRYFLGTIVKSLLWFPFAFVVLFLPITIAGLMRISGMTNRDALLCLAGVTASLNGFVNVLILYNVMRVLQSALSSGKASTATESFVVGEERKPSPIESPKPRPFDRISSPVTTPGSVQHGRAFPPPVSRVASPLSSTRSAYGLPASPRSGRVALPPRRSEEKMEHTPTPEMRKIWLQHSRSTSSVDSTTTLLRAGSSLRIAHSRNGSASTSSENIHTLIGKPILPSSEINKRVDADVMSTPSRSQTSTPAPVITVVRPESPGSSGLPPPPRPSRTESIRESLLNINMRLAEVAPSARPAPPVTSADRSPESVYTQPGSLSDSRSHGHSIRTSFSFDHDDFEIQRVESRERLRPAVSAVARIPRSPSRSPSRSSSRSASRSASTSPSRPPSPPAHVSEAFPTKHTSGMASTVSLPESVGSMSLHTAESEDTMHAEIRSRADSDDSRDGALSSIAWASLVAHATVQDRLTGEATLRSPDTWDDDDRDEALAIPRRPRRMSDIPMVLRPGTPDSMGQNMYFRFDELGSPSQTQKEEEAAGKVGNPSSIRISRPVPAPMLGQVRSLKGTGASATSSNNNGLGRSNSPFTVRDVPRGYL